MQYLLKEIGLIGRSVAKPRQGEYHQRCAIVIVFMDNSKPRLSGFLVMLRLGDSALLWPMKFD